MTVSVDEVKRLEIENELHKKLICGIHFWDFCRYPLYLDARNQSTKEPIRTHRFSILKAIFSSLFYLLALGKKMDFLVIQHPRLRLINGRYVDVYTDCIVGDLKKNGLSVETLTRYSIDAGTKIGASFANLAAIEATSRLVSRFLFFLIPIKTLPNVLEKINSDLGVRFFNLRKVRTEVLNFLIVRKLYLFILKWKRPKNVMLVVSAGHEALISACKILSIPTFEVQHGSPGLDKLNYDYSNGCTKEYFPDFFLGHGRGFNLEKILPKCKIIYLGCPFLDTTAVKASENKKTFDFLFISQPAVDEIIIARARQANNQGKSIGIRLHPNYVDIDDRHRELEAEGVKLISAKHETLYASFSRSRNVVGCFSTALFEATVFNVGIWIIESGQQNSMSKLLDSGRAKMWPSELKDTLFEKTKVSFKEEYFEPYNIQKLFYFLSSEEIIDNDNAHKNLGKPLKNLKKKS